MKVRLKRIKAEFGRAGSCSYVNDRRKALKEWKISLYIREIGLIRYKTTELY